MPSTWNTIRIFISSTFRNMHAERDHIVKVIFPELWGQSIKHWFNPMVLDICRALKDEICASGQLIMEDYPLVGTIRRSTLQRGIYAEKAV